MNIFSLIVNKIPGVKPFVRSLRLLYHVQKYGSYRFVTRYPPGHYYSPIPNMKEIAAHSNRLFKHSSVDLPGLNMRERPQLELLHRFSNYYEDLPFTATPNDSFRYYYKNGGWFEYSDAIILYCVLRQFEPRQVIEIGSGFSSAVMLDTSDMSFGSCVDFTFIEPYPARLNKIMLEQDKDMYSIIEKPIQDVPTEIFLPLSHNDILFIDSSHVVKIGSDVFHILFDILPKIRRGVIIHFHDIFWPFQYPKEWVMDRDRAWNEVYFLRAFLQYNNDFEIMYFNSFLEHCHTKTLESKMPLCLKSKGSSLWIRKMT